MRTARWRDLVTEATLAALQEVKSTQGATVRRMAESLDVVAATILLQTVGMEQLSHPRVTTVEETLATTQSVSAIARLLELGLIIATWGPVDSTDVVAVVMRHGVAEMLRTSANYRPTELGKEPQP